MVIRHRCDLRLCAGLLALLIVNLPFSLMLQAQEEIDPTVQAIMNDIILTATADAQQGGLVATAQSMLTETAAAPDALGPAIDNSSLGVSPFRISNRINRNEVFRVAMSPDGNLVVGGTDSYDPNTEGSDFLAIWDANTGAVLQTFDVSRLPGEELSIHRNIVVWDLGFSPDGRLLAVALERQGSTDSFGDRSKILLWDVVNQNFSRVLNGTGNTNISDMAFSPDGTLLAVAQTDGSIRLWIVESATELALLSGHEARVRSILFSLDGRFLYSGSTDETIRVWDMTSGFEVAHLDAGEEIYDIAYFAPTGEIAFAGGSNRRGYIGLWNGQNGQAATRMVETENSREATVVRFSPDYSIAYFETRDLAAIDVATGEELFFISSGGDIHDVDISADGTKIAIGSDDGTVSVWSLVRQ